MEKLCKTHRIPVDPRARGKGNSLASQEKGKRENRIFPLVENQPFFPIFDQKNRFSTRKTLWKRRTEEKKQALFPKRLLTSRYFCEGRGFSKRFPPRFPPLFPRGINRPSAEDPLCGKARSSFPQFPQALLLLLLFYCIYRLSSSASRKASAKRTEKSFGIFRGEESAKA